MEERKIFDPQFVHFMWDDSLEGKEGFFGDCIDVIVSRVNKNITETVDKKYTFGSCTQGASTYPFSLMGAHYRFFYYDPNYDVKLAYVQGKAIQFREKGDANWIDTNSPSWIDRCEYRVKPELYKVVMDKDTDKIRIDTSDAHIYDSDKVEHYGTKEECIQYMIEQYCKGCSKQKHSPCPYDYCTGFEPMKKWRPFKDIQELKKVWHSKRYSIDTVVSNPLEEPMIWVRSKSNTSSTYLITAYIENMGVVHLYGDLNMGLEQLFDDYTFLDGTPCGVEE